MVNPLLNRALGAVAGGFTGYSVDKQRRQEEERLRKEEARQQMLDAISLIKSNAMPVEEMGAPSGTPAAGMGAMRAGAPPQGSVASAINAATAAAPEKSRGVRISFGGKEWEMPTARQVKAEESAATLAAREAELKLAQRLKQEEINAQAKELAQYLGGDTNKAKQLLSGVSADILGIDAMSPLEKERVRASIAQSQASAAAARAQVAQANREYQGDLDKAEAWWNEGVADPRQRAEKSAEFIRMRNSKANANKSPQEIMLAMYRKSQETAKSAPKQSPAESVLAQIQAGAAIPAAASAPQAQASASTQAVYQDALNAIQEGAPREAVIQRYESVTKTKWPGG